ncbi:MAG: HlyD family efflux transporter periplasmic adaptor subunit [Terricaulis sp.]
MADDVRARTADAPASEAPRFQMPKLRSSMQVTRQRLLLIIAGAVVVLAVIIGGYWTFVGSHYEATDDAYVGASSAQISAQVSGLVSEVPVSETMTVHRGDVLVKIDPSDAQIALEQAQANYQRTLLRVRQYYSQSSSAAADVSARQADVARAQADYSRRARLASTGAVSGEELSTARAALSAAQANLTAARAAYATQRTLISGGSAEQNPEALAAKAQMDAAQLALTRTTIVAPIDGVVTNNRAQVGQRVEPGGTLMSIAPLAQAYVDANFKESQLRRMHIGQSVELTSDLYGSSVKFHGRIAGLGGGTGSSQAVIPAQNATGNWIKVVQRVPVRIHLDPAELAQHPLRVGLSMQATVDVSAH